MNRTDTIHLDRAGRSYVIHKGRVLVWKSEHPLEERVLELTDDYRNDDGTFIVPEPIAWDGVETCPGIFFGPPE